MKRHFKIILKVRYRAESKVKHTLERPGIWPFNKRKCEGITTTPLECDDCVIRVAEANLGEVVKMMSEDLSLKQLVGSIPNVWATTDPFRQIGTIPSG